MYLNLGACQLYLNEEIEAQIACQLALSLDNNNTKALFRYAKAILRLEDITEDRMQLS